MSDVPVILSSGRASLPRHRERTLDSAALDLMHYLDETGGATKADICAAMKWTESRFKTVLQHARENVGADLKLAIPQPVPQDGFMYRVTGEWIRQDGTAAIKAGVDYSMLQIESRLRNVWRDVCIARANADGRSIHGRKLNFLDKRLGYIVDTLKAIDEDGRDRGAA